MKNLLNFLLKFPTDIFGFRLNFPFMYLYTKRVQILITFSFMLTRCCFTISFTTHYCIHTHAVYCRMKIYRVFSFFGFSFFWFIKECSFFCRHSRRGKSINFSSPKSFFFFFTLTMCFTIFRKIFLYFPEKIIC